MMNANSMETGLGYLKEGSIEFDRTEILGRAVVQVSQIADKMGAAAESVS